MAPKRQPVKSCSPGVYIVKYRPEIAGLLFSVSALVASARSAPDAQPLAKETEVRGYWIDPSTKLMWAGKDNGRDVRWKGAVKYCRDLRLAGHSDWRLATLAELGAIYDRNANAPGLSGSGKENDFTYHVKGNLFLTGDEWSSEQRTDDRGHPSGYVWFFDFNEGLPNNEPTGWPNPSTRCALCVRSSEK